jgi:hypothetical protein
MKAIKIILAIAVIALIGFFVWKWLVGINPPPPPPPPINQFTARITSEIDSLSKSPANVFCPKFYKDIQFRITDYHKQKFFGKSESDNDQWKEILQKNLYSAYAPKFVEQAMYVFGGSDWRNDNLQFIRSEVKTLQSSAYLGQGSVDTSFKKILNILAKHDEIAGFISACNNFSYSYYGLSDHFPDVSDKIQKSRAYLANNLDNHYVNNCARLKNGLQTIPQTLFNTHITYLRDKIELYSEKYTEYNSQAEYSNAIYTPLRNQIGALDNGTYGGISNFASAYSSLEELLTEDNVKAFNYFRSLSSSSNQSN